MGIQMSDQSIAIVGVLCSLLMAGWLRYVVDDGVERQAHGHKLCGSELRMWIKRRTGRD